jgi:branched-chain amino acid transport system substrate-binding protein
MFARILLALTVLALCAGPAAAAPSGDPILVGGLFAESGPAAFVGTPSRLVAEMTVKKINDAGGILGRPIKLVIHDTESTPTWPCVWPASSWRPKTSWPSSAPPPRARVWP